MGRKVESGVNRNGVQWVKEGNTFYCVYYFGNGAEITRSYSNVQHSFIEKLTFESMTKGKNN